MWLVFLKILLCIYLTNNVNCYQYSGVYTKSSYVNDKWKNSKNDNNNKNHIASSSTLQRNYPYTTISPYHYTSNVHLRHNRFHNLDKVMNRLDHFTTTTPSYKTTTHHNNEDDYDFMADDNYDDQEYDDEVEEDEDDWVSDFKLLLF